MTDVLVAIYGLLGNGLAAVLDGIAFCFEWLAEVVAAALDAVLDVLIAAWNGCIAVIVASFEWIVDQIPPGWKDYFDWGTGVPGGESWQSYFGNVWHYWADLDYVFPITPMLLLIATVFGIVGVLRLLRWCLGAVPFTNL